MDCIVPGVTKSWTQLSDFISLHFRGIKDQIANICWIIEKAKEFQKNIYFCFSEVTVKVIQSCPTLCDPMDYTVQGILQARILEWVAIPFSRVSNPGY